MNKNKSNEVPCPSCGFYSIGESIFGSFNICDICGWEDDNVQLANPSSSGGANKISLIESQIIILNKIPLEIKEYNGIKRDRKWRPLNKQEIAKFNKEKEIKYWKNMGIINISETYWMK